MALNMKPDFPVIDPKPGFRKTVANFNLEDYILRIGDGWRVRLSCGFLLRLRDFFSQAQRVFPQ
ncbi:hypothetical protein ACJIZ3_023326 [Penstemon smallii]|uniref:NADH-ubiquinone oxidoreductase 21kDa subunit N-terminal domain-containing protein n=1 Tax=Penstemon smallii TaxID=265156 RepID=A0ABD3TR53_9LAMI